MKKKLEAIKQLTIGAKIIGVVKVPDDLKGEHLLIHFGGLYSDVSYGKLFYKELPPGQWSIIARANELTGEQARGLVGFIENPEPNGDIPYKNYCHSFLGCSTATESLLSWCKANGIKEQDLIIVKQ